MREALLFGAAHGLFAFDDEHGLVPAPKPRALSRYLRETTDEVKECVKKAEFAGKWLAAPGSVGKAKPNLPVGDMLTDVMSGEL